MLKSPFRRIAARRASSILVVSALLAAGGSALPAVAASEIPDDGTAIDAPIAPEPDLTIVGDAAGLTIVDDPADQDTASPTVAEAAQATATDTLNDGSDTIDGWVTIIVEEGKPGTGGADIETVYVVSEDDGFVEVGPEILQVAEVGDLVSVELDARGELASVEVVGEAIANGAVAEASAAGSHILDIVVMSPSGTTIPNTAADTKAIVTAVGQYWNTQTGNQMSFTVNTPVLASGKLPTCTDPKPAWNLAKTLVGYDWSAYVGSDGWLIPVPAGTPSTPPGRHLMVLAVGCGAGGWGSSSIGNNFASGGLVSAFGDFMSMPDLVAHEIGHNLSLDHARRIVCSGNVAEFQGALQGGACDATGPTAQNKPYEYGDIFDPMAVSGRATATKSGSTFTLAKMGYLSSPQADRVGINVGRVDLNSTGVTTVTLSSMGSGSGTRAVTATDPTSGETYWFELRAAGGYEWAHQDPCVAGKVCYTNPDNWDTMFDYGVRVLKQYPSLNAPTLATTTEVLRNVAKGNRYYFSAGDTFTDITSKVKMQVNSVSGTTATITVAINQALPATTPTTPAPSTPTTTPPTTTPAALRKATITAVMPVAQTSIVGKAIPPVTIPAGVATPSSTITYAVKSGTTLPAGITFNPKTRVFSGKPTKAGTYTVWITESVKDTAAAKANSVDKKFTWTVNPATKATILVSVPAAQTSKVGKQITPVALKKPVLVGATAPQFGYSISGLPSGLNFDPKTMKFVGKVAANAPVKAYLVTVKFTAGSVKSSNSFIWNVTK